MGVAEHKHEWRTRYETFDYRYDCASGMECKVCLARLDQLTVEQLVNDTNPEPDYDREGLVVKT